MTQDNIFTLFSTAAEDAENGKWFKFGQTIEVKIRRFKSKKSRKVRETLEAPYARAQKGGAKLPDDVQETITNEHIATGIIADWKGITDKSGKPLDYTRDNAIALMEQLPEFRDTVAQISLDLNNYVEEEQKEVAGN